MKIERLAIMTALGMATGAAIENHAWWWVFAGAVLLLLNGWVFTRDECPQPKPKQWVKPKPITGPK